MTATNVTYGDGVTTTPNNNWAILYQGQDLVQLAKQHQTTPEAILRFADRANGDLETKQAPLDIGDVIIIEHKRLQAKADEEARAEQEKKDAETKKAERKCRNCSITAGVSGGVVGAVGAAALLSNPGGWVILGACALCAAVAGGLTYLWTQP